MRTLLKILLIILGVEVWDLDLGFLEILTIYSQISIRRRPFKRPPMGASLLFSPLSRAAKPLKGGVLNE